jgi:hypothetical protein
MANAQITTKTGNVIEVAFEDILHWLSKAQALTLKGPQIIAAVTVILQAVDKVVLDAQTDVASPTSLINIPMDLQQLQDIKAVWPDIKALFKI